MRYNFVILQYKRKRTRNFNSTAHTFITRKDVSYILQPPIHLNFRQHKHYTELNTIHCQRPGRGLGTARRNTRRFSSSRYRLVAFSSGHERRERTPSIFFQHTKPLATRSAKILTITRPRPVHG